ncbi:non-hydrolyzing UDP-N-acetylglucosamine 2-epimerase [Pediococcus acidilactici]|uniref:non-hydrolyzing UDP-N-acetylglucosamine 2-epimerase n=1 Tax=Pediococcus acidilactici TaxID=1254 RepID=UPI0013251B22|nr:UDP-N-acetylglucosamine 2-epimerase (non-hydrolyzing) [Pediococcus acidilactici]KAF0370177.1 UDP-N-acetylglucosamine 2-epimerase (non-hydrolyzing) [Pediococcus acidilactici]KAF0381950.1 UDP-N-acetylglucosamine 2-epimerase (non-hydrolyzing) [Pediococcus acidilactici]KAF0455154.1 UDP-N-acetylglucosamine 2-epimerase (non-hydrolyzing) [Pediococcus acidilactici]KAF0477309.1 UDP-N-acetylglucosamine 2-epimerase (non-hydrolyzing) [Pediococcus acidilactici]KAF0538101.1 UDP-N-acetylglucosamine 2-epim
MRKNKVLVIFGTRPEAIKMAPVIKELEQRANTFETVVVTTGQHKEMLVPILETFKIKPNYDLDIMKKSQTLGDITISILKKLDPIIKNEKPDVVLVHGDTTTTFAAGLAAFYNQVKIGHVEAGLRTWDLSSPFPEEMNRQSVDVLSDFYFAPTLLSKRNLEKENHSTDNIYVTGNTAIDALKYTVSDNFTNNVINKLDKNKKTILITMHRRENIGKPMENVFKAVNSILDEHNDLQFVFPVHKNPAVRNIVDKYLKGNSRVHLVEPMDVIDFHNVIKKCYLVMTDSGGVQEEAPSLHTPVLVLRTETERPEGVQAGTLKIVGTDEENVKREVESLLNNEEEYTRMSNAKNPYGDGNASVRIADVLEEHLKNGRN